MSVTLIAIRQDLHYEKPNVAVRFATMPGDQTVRGNQTLQAVRWKVADDLGWGGDRHE